MAARLHIKRVLRQTVERRKAMRKHTKNLKQGRKLQATKSLYSFGASNPANVGGNGARAV